MAPHPENTGSLKRGRVSPGPIRSFPCSTSNDGIDPQATVDRQGQDVKKPRRSQRISSQTKPRHTPVAQSYLPTPLTNQGSTATDIRDDATATPPNVSDKLHRRTPSDSPLPAFPSPPGDTQCLSQFVYPPRAFVDEVEDEAAEGVWGYLIPLNDRVRDALVLRKRDGCGDRKNNERPGKGAQRQGKDTKGQQGQDKASPSGYLVGRHPECGK